MAEYLLLLILFVKNKDGLIFVLNSIIIYEMNTGILYVSIIKSRVGLVLTLPNVISQYLFFFFSFYIFLFVSLSTIYFYCRTTETPKGTNHRCSKM